MIIIKLTKVTYNLAINQSLSVLKRGGLVVYPTETAYGLGADFFKAKARRKIYSLKGRQNKKPLSVIVAGQKMAEQAVKFDSVAEKLALKYWPGALTLILPTKGAARKVQKTLALRVSANKFARQLCQELNRPITATSANLSGQGECYAIGQLLKQWKNQKNLPDLIIDAGRLSKRKPSTIVDLTRGKIKILRQGKIKIPNFKHQ